MKDKDIVFLNLKIFKKKITQYNEFAFWLFVNCKNLRIYTSKDYNLFLKGINLTFNECLKLVIYYNFFYIKNYRKVL